MECWGVGPMDNDVALNWLQSVRDVGAVRTALDDRNVDVALAACAVVAWAAGWPMPEAPLECDRRQQATLAAMRRPARRRCEALMATGSPLHTAWSEAGHLDDWLQTVSAMRDVLATLAPEHAALRERLTEPAQIEAFEQALDGLDGTPRERRLAKRTLQGLRRELG